MAILLAALFGIATKTVDQGANSVGSKNQLDDGELPEARSGHGGEEAESQPRVRDTRSKLRSLFDVRKGEIAALSIPPEIMKSLLSSMPPDGPDGAANVDRNAPRMVGTFNRESSLQLLQPVERSIKGVVDTSEGAFEMNVGKLKVSGSAFGDEGTTRLHATVLAGTNGIECITRIPDGSCLLLSSGGENPEGVLIVAGPPGPSEGQGK